jgi:hypothetical protein
VIDETVHPGPEFMTAFENISKAFHQQNETGRRNYLNLFLSNIILRPEFEGTLRIFADDCSANERHKEAQADWKSGLYNWISKRN